MWILPWIFISDVALCIVCDIYIILNLIDGLFGFQELARGNGEGVNESVNLDIHAISELKSKGLPPTIDLPKYDYSYNDSGKYGEDHLYYV